MSTQQYTAYKRSKRVTYASIQRSAAWQHAANDVWLLMSKEQACSSKEQSTWLGCSGRLTLGRLHACLPGTRSVLAGRTPAG
jgi:hypothetical protein